MADCPQVVRLGGLVGLAAAASALLFAYDPMEVGFFPRCPFLLATGWQCPGCGSLRAIHALLHGHFAAAWLLNPLLLAALPYVALGYLTEWRADRSYAWARFRKTAYGPTAIPVVAVVIVAYAVSRNLA